MTLTVKKPRKYGPLAAIRKKCVWCCLDQPREATLCPAEGCVLHSWRNGRPADADRSPLKTIRRKCLDDCGNAGAVAGVRDCEIEACPLWPHRMGKRPTDTDWLIHWASLGLIPSKS